MSACGARAHQGFSDGDATSDGGSQSMDDLGTEPKIPQAPFLEPNNHQTSAGPLPEDAAGKAVGRRPSVSRGHGKSL